MIKTYQNLIKLNVIINIIVFLKEPYSALLVLSLMIGLSGQNLRQSHLWSFWVILEYVQQNISILPIMACVTLEYIQSNWMNLERCVSDLKITIHIINPKLRCIYHWTRLVADMKIANHIQWEDLNDILLGTIDWFIRYSMNQTWFVSRTESLFGDLIWIWVSHQIARKRQEIEVFVPPPPPTPPPSFPPLCRNPMLYFSFCKS